MNPNAHTWVPSWYPQQKEWWNFILNLQGEWSMKSAHCMHWLIFWLTPTIWLLDAMLKSQWSRNCFAYYWLFSWHDYRDFHIKCSLWKWFTDTPGSFTCIMDSLVPRLSLLRKRLGTRLHHGHKSTKHIVRLFELVLWPAHMHHFITT